MQYNTTQLLKLLQVARYRWLSPRTRFCNVCGRRCGGFLPYRGGSKDVPSAMRVVKMIGSDVDHFECPHCGAHDRERHVLLYMRASGVWALLEGAEILHFAPAKRLSRLIAAQKPKRYVKADLYPVSDDIQRMDMHDIPAADGTFDVVIANHVLEHVEDDRRAVGEISRVLRPGGYAILQTPFSRVLEHTFSDPGIRDEVSRRECYGQEDHVRLFGRDVFERIAQIGAFEMRVATHQETLPGFDPFRHGVNRDEPFFLFRKPA